MFFFNIFGSMVNVLNISLLCVMFNTVLNINLNVHLLKKIFYVQTDQILVFFS